MRDRRTGRTVRTQAKTPLTRLAVVAVVVMATALVSCGGSDDSGANPARFCEINDELEQLGELTTAAPDDARELATRTSALLAEAEQTAPTEIRDKVGPTAAAYREILDFYAEAEFDVDEAAFEAAIAAGEIGLDPPEAQVVFDWIDENCPRP